MIKVQLNGRDHILQLGLLRNRFFFFFLLLFFFFPALSLGLHALAGEIVKFFSELVKGDRLHEEQKC